MSRVLDSFPQGMFNAFLTMRVGYSVRNACAAITFRELESARSLGCREARGNLIYVAKEIFSKCGSRLKNFITQFFPNAEAKQ